MTELALASVLTITLVSLRVGQGPALLAISTLLHLRAAWVCVGVCWRKAAQTWRERYRECYEEVAREIGR